MNQSQVPSPNRSATHEARFFAATLSTRKYLKTKVRQQDLVQELVRTWARAVVATALRWPLPQDRAEVMQRCSSVLIAPTFKTIGLQVTCHIVKTCHHIHPLNAQLCKPTHKTLPPLLICVLMGAQRREGRARKGTAGNKHAKTLSNTESGKGKFLDLMVRERGWRGMCG